MRNSRYLILFIVFSAGVAAPLNQFKVPPMMNQLMSALGVNLAVSGWFMSVFALVGVLFALPSGYLIRKIGMKFSGIIALSALLAGSVTGGLSHSAGILIFSRVIEGVGLCLISVTGPASISAWFPDDKRGMAMGIWATWVPTGTIIMYLLAPLLGEWRSAWFFTSVYTAAVLVLFALFFHMPAEYTQTRAQDEERRCPYKEKNIWFLAAVFMTSTIVIVAVKTYAPVFLEQKHGLSTAKASGLTVLIMLFSLITAPLSGWLSDVFKSRKVLLISGILLACFSMTFLFSSSTAYFAVLLILLGITGGIVPTATFSSVPEIMKLPRLTGQGMSVIALGQNVGMFAGPVMFSFLADYYSWQTAGVFMVPLLICACITAFFIKVR